MSNKYAFKSCNSFFFFLKAVSGSSSWEKQQQAWPKTTYMTNKEVGRHTRMYFYKLVFLWHLYKKDELRAPPTEQSFSYLSQSDDL